MDFNDTPEEAAFRAEVRGWLEANAQPKGPDDPPNDALGERGDPETIKAAKAWQKKKADAGWACISWPKEYGGREATPIPKPRTRGTWRVQGLRSSPPWSSPKTGTAPR